MARLSAGTAATTEWPGCRAAPESLVPRRGDRGPTEAKRVEEPARRSESERRSPTRDAAVGLGGADARNAHASCCLVPPSPFLPRGRRMSGVLGMNNPLAAVKNRRALEMMATWSFASSASR